MDKLRGIEADAVLVGTVTGVKDGTVSVNLRMVDTSSSAVLHSARKLVQNPERPIEPIQQKKAEASKKKKVTKKGADSKEAGKEPDILDRILHAIYDR